MKFLIAASIWIMFSFVGCAGHSTWHGSGANARHSDAREILEQSDVASTFTDATPEQIIQNNNMLRAAVYANMDVKLAASQKERATRLEQIDAAVASLQAGLEGIK